ncbi:ABC transporter permease [Deinococcus radiophilus]|uniref:ABC transporter permease n=1 Tax=Deinococcus radiophilus TaxID=32062 RepID=A0A3S0IJW1_9DEIO|nr:ABC transporter permease [Deinococcus radiophilus]RTR25647.1 ABC transporter permease [Deinococcus radiophilus]UFA50891.1 ABC transporter permease [Deinococcus radiophilus]
MRPEMIRRVAVRDLLSTLRDTRTLLGTLLIPLVLIPLLMLGLPLLMSEFIGGQVQERQQVGVIGTLPPALERQLEDGGTSVTDGTGVDLVPLNYQTPEAARSAVQSEQVDAVIRVVEPLPDAASGETATPARLEVYAKLNSLAAQTGALGKVESAVDEYNQALAARRLEAAGLSEADLSPITLDPQEAATAQEAGSGQLAFLIPLLMMNFILSGAMATALDSTAGEKERGTLESLLVSPVARSEVVAGKLLATTITALAAAAASVLGLLGTGLIAGLVLVSGGMDAEISQAFGGQLTLGGGSVLGLALSALGAALLISAVLIALSIYARSYKEAQTYVTPLSLLIVVPALFLQFSDGFDTAFYGVPLFGSMLSVMDAVTGTLQWPQLWLSLGANLLLTAVLGAVALRSFGREEVIFRN